MSDSAEVAALRQRVAELEEELERSRKDIKFYRAIGSQTFARQRECIVTAESERDAARAEAEQLHKERDALLTSVKEALGLISGWREAVAEIEEFCGEPVRIKNMLAAIDQMDTWKRQAIDAAKENTGGAEQVRKDKGEV